MDDVSTLAGPGGEDLPFIGGELPLSPPTVHSGLTVNAAVPRFACVCAEEARVRAGSIGTTEGGVANGATDEGCRSEGELRRGRDADRLGCPDRDGRRAGAPCRRLPSDRSRRVPGDHDPRAVCQGPAVSGRLRRDVEHPRPEISGCRRRFDEQVPELGDGRPGEMGPGRVRLPAGGLPRCGTVGRVSGRVLPARESRLLPLHRVGCRASLVEREGRRSSASRTTPSTSGSSRRCSLRI